MSTKTKEQGEGCKPRVLAALAIIVALSCVSCFEHKPEIAGYHWNGSVLYDKNGTEVASVVTMPSFFDSSQACIFLAAGLGYSECTHWEKGQQAYDHIAAEFKRAERERAK